MLNFHIILFKLNCILDSYIPAFLELCVIFCPQRETGMHWEFHRFIFVLKDENKVTMQARRLSRKIKIVSRQL